TGPDDIPPGAVVSGVQLNLTSIESELRGHPRAYAYSVDPDFDSTTVEWADYSWEVFGAPPPGNLRGTDQLHLGVHRTMGTDPEITCSDGALQAFPRNGWGMSGELWSNSPIWQDSPAQTRDSA